MLKKSENTRSQMSVAAFKKALQAAVFSFHSANKKTTPTGQIGILAYAQQKAHTSEQAYSTALELLSKTANRLGDEGSQIRDLIFDLQQEQDRDEQANLLAQLRELSRGLRDGEFSIEPIHVPGIGEDVALDLEEMERCYNAGCYRSAVILCGRVLEAALHRKYYDVTGSDLLEKAPGIGLGNLIAKMGEKNIRMDPGIANQIHLVNQVRIHSVHKKQETFYPSKEQTRAIILYTSDVIRKLFA